MDSRTLVDDVLMDLNDLLKTVKEPAHIPYVERALVEMEKLKKLMGE